MRILFGYTLQEIIQLKLPFGNRLNQYAFGFLDNLYVAPFGKLVAGCHLFGQP